MANRRFRRYSGAVRRLLWIDVLLGGIVFWLPGVTYYYVARSEPSVTGILGLTFGMPLVVWIAYGIVWTRSGGRESLSVALSMLLGIWLLGPTMIAMAETFAGAGFKAGPSVWIMTAIGTLVPVYTLMMAAYNFTALALLLATVLLILLHRRFERGRHLWPSE